MSGMTGCLQLPGKVSAGKKQTVAFPVALLILGRKRRERRVDRLPPFEHLRLLLFYRFTLPATRHLSPGCIAFVIAVSNTAVIWRLTPAFRRKTCRIERACPRFVHIDRPRAEATWFVSPAGRSRPAGGNTAQKFAIAVEKRSRQPEDPMPRYPGQGSVAPLDRPSQALSRPCPPRGHRYRRPMLAVV